MLAMAGGLLRWLLRLSMAPASTLHGFRTWVLEECPVAPGRAARPAPRVRSRAQGGCRPAPGQRATAARPMAAANGKQESLFTVDWVPAPSGRDAVASPVADADPSAGVSPDPRCVVLGDGEAVREIVEMGGSHEVFASLAALGEALEERGGVTPTADPARSVLVNVGRDEDSDLPGQARQTLGKVLSVLQEWLADERFSDWRLAVVTHGAVVARTGENVDSLIGAGVWGLVRSAQAEHPGRITLVDIDGAQSSWEVLPSALAHEGESQLALRGGEVLVPRLVRVPAGGVTASSGDEENNANVGEEAFDPGRSTLVTGGTGVLGGLVARHLVSVHGVRSLVLTSRRGLDAPGAVELQSELERLGAKVVVQKCDVSDREQVQILLDQVPSTFPLGAVVHAAGVLDDGVISSLSPERLERVWAAKADSAWHLHELTAGMDLDAFVLFSSAAATLGSPGQGNYAAANAFLDGLAAHRRAQGLAGASLAWGLWGHASELTGGLDEADRARMERLGFFALADEEGLELFDLARQAKLAQLMAVRLDLALARRRASEDLLPPLLRSVVRVASRRGADRGSLMRRLAALPERERERAILEWVRKEVAVVLGHAGAGAIDPESTFKDLGFDSLAAVELRNRLNSATRLSLPATLVFDHPTPSHVAGYIWGQIGTAHDVGRESKEANVRAALTSIPLARLQETGMLDVLLRLAASDDVISQSPSALAERDAIDEMDVEGLVNAVLVRENGDTQ